MKDFEPGENTGAIASVTDKVRPVDIGVPVTSVQFLGERAAFVGAEENVYLVNARGEVSPSAVHGGGILCTAQPVRNFSRWAAISSAFFFPMARRSKSASPSE